MKVTLEKKEKNNVHLEVEVDLDMVKKALEHAYRQVSQQVNIPGFRRGKAPRQLVEKAVGADYIKREALEKLIPEALEIAVHEQSLEMIERPDVEIVKFETAEPLVFKATVPVRPEVNFTGSYTELSAQAPKIELDPAAVDGKIEQLRESKFELVAVERPVEMGGHVVMDFSGRLADQEEAFAGGTATDYKSEIAQGRFIDGFVDHLIGLKAGESVEFEVNFPEQYHAPELAGKPAIFNVTIKEVQARQLPELDDAFAQSVGEYANLAELRAGTEKELQEEAEESREQLLRQQILDQVLSKAEVDVPASMVVRETEFLMRQYAQAMQAQGMDVERLFTPERVGQWRESLRDEATKRIRTSLTLGTIAKAEGLSVTTEEVDAEVAQYAGMYRVDPAAVREQLVRSGGWTALADEVLSNKILDWLRERAQIIEGPIPEAYAPKTDAVEENVEVDSDAAAAVAE